MVSIIIPTYNRAEFLPETLNSILSQSYANWECIVVDDQSTDQTKEIMSKFLRRDPRFKYYLRPNELARGANSCRNLGFKKSKGLYVKWFDSDDIMLNNHLKKSVKILKKSQKDFVIGKSLDFDSDKDTDLGIPLSYPINQNFSLEDFVKMRISWITDDFLGKRDILNRIDFNEKLNSGQDYNFFAKVLAVTENGVCIDEVITRRRIHSKSIRGKLKDDYIYNLKENVRLKYHMYMDVMPIVYFPNDLRKWFLKGFMQLAYQLACERHISSIIFKSVTSVFQEFGIFRAVLYFISIITGFILKKVIVC